MTQSWIIYGLVAALSLGLANIPQKLALGSGQVSPFAYGMAIGLTLIIFNAIAFCLSGDSLNLTTSKTAWLWTLAGVTVFTIGSMAIALGFRAGAPASAFPALFNLNTVVAAIAGIILLKEFGQVSTPRVLAGSMLAVAGAVLATWR